MLVGFLAIFLTGAGTIAAQPKSFRPAPDYGRMGQPNQAEGRKIIAEFRSQGLYPNDDYIEFELRLMPRRGAERIVPGRMWIGRNEAGPATRLVLAPGVEGQEERLLVENGSAGGVWRWKTGRSEKLPPQAWFDALAGTDVTAFDLQLGFLYWPDYVFEGVSKVRGRPAHVFLMYPPSEVASQKPELSGVRVYLDTQYKAPVQFEELNRAGQAAKSVTVIDLKKVGEQWLPKAIDFRDEATRDKSRFRVTGAATAVEFSAALFDPASLNEVIAPPPADKIEQLGL
jgi:outer membrane lipoprotein-sorting protein